MTEEREALKDRQGPGPAPVAPHPVFVHSLRFRMGITLAVALTAATAFFAFLIIARTRDEFLRQAIGQNQQLAEVIRRSTRYAMLQNHREQVAGIINAVSRTRGIEKIRILDKDGTIISSTLPADVGRKVDKTAEECYHCHVAGEPLQQIPGSERHRIYTSSLGHRLLGTIDVIRNEPACSTAACHAHPPTTTVLGVLDIAYSLEEMDHRLRDDVAGVIGIAAALALAIFLVVATVVQRFIYVPLRDLEDGARRVSTGDRSHLIPVRSTDEIGHLASSFNAMTVALRDYEGALEEWNRTLENKVREKTAELRVAESKSIQTEKLASVGLLAAGVAHEINNPLTGVLTFAHLVRAKLAAGSPEAEDMDVIIRETKRCAAIIRRLLDFAREKKPEMSFADLNQVLLETIQLVEHQAGFQNVAFSLDLDRTLPPLWIDPNQLKQVFMNILVNGKEAMEERGTFTIRTRRRPDLAKPGGAEGAFPVEVVLQDSGCGIPEADIAKIFDPFFTSKEPGKGVGLGLSVSYSIVKAHGGTIEVDSSLGRGTTFHIIIPPAARSPEAAGARHGS